MKSILVSVVVFFVGLLLVLSPVPGSARVYISVGDANVKKSLLALPAFQLQGDSQRKRDIELGEKIFSSLSQSLEFSNYFEFVDPKAFLEDPQSVGLRPAPEEPGGFEFKKWSVIGTEFLLRGGYKVKRRKVEFELNVYYVPQAKVVLQKVYRGTNRESEKIAYAAANDIIKALTGKEGIFKTKIVTLRSQGRRGKGVFVMDWNGKNLKKVSRLRTIHLSPTWSASGRQIAYTAYAYHPRARVRNPDIFIRDLEKRTNKIIFYGRGVNSGAAFHPLKDYLYFTRSQDGHPDIYRINSDGKELVRLTNGPHGAMNVEPKISPDGEKVVFSSDRSGRPMIYTMNVNGGEVKRLTFAGRYNSTPDWSPDGKLLAFAAHVEGRYDIFSIQPDGRGLRRITFAKKEDGSRANNEHPSFSPDGRHILFSSDRTGRRQLYVISPDGKNERQITFGNDDYSMPEWSPYLQ